MAACCTYYQPTTVAKQKPFENAYLLTKNTDDFSGKNQNGPVGEKKDETERATAVGRRTREEILQWNQMTTL